MPGWDDVNDSDWDEDPSEGAPSEEGAALAAPAGSTRIEGMEGEGAAASEVQHQCHEFWWFSRAGGGDVREECLCYALLRWSFS